MIQAFESEQLGEFQRTQREVSRESRIRHEAIEHTHPHGALSRGGGPLGRGIWLMCTFGSPSQSRVSDITRGDEQPGKRAKDRPLDTTDL